MRKPCCCDKHDTNRGAWSKEEDQKLAKHIQTHGEGSWKSIPQAAGLLRCGKSCRLRWNNYLRPNLKQRYFGEDEEDLIVKLHALLGNRWSLIAGRLPGRTDNEVKNYWNSHLRRKLMSMGIDPNNHQVRWKHHELGTRFPSNLGSMVVNANDKPRNHYNGRFSSDATSSLEDDASSLPDLNLDLSISVEPSPQMDECMGIKDATPTTLPLFT